MNCKTLSAKRAFTLIELVFCLVILGILSAVAVRSLGQKSSPRSAAYSVMRDLNYISRQVYNNPRVLFKANQAAGSVSAQSGDATSFWRVIFRGATTELGSNGAKRSSKAKYGFQGYEIYQSAPFSAVAQAGAAVNYLPDYMDGRKIFAMPKPKDKTNKFKQAMQKMAPRLDIGKQFNASVVLYLQLPGQDSYVRLDHGRGGARSGLSEAMIYIDPQNGSFMLPIGPASAYSGGLATPMRIGGRLVLQFFDPSVLPSTSSTIMPGTGRAKRATYCIAINAQSNSVEDIIRDSNKRQVAFTSKDGSKKVYCDQLHPAKAKGKIS